MKIKENWKPIKEEPWFTGGTIIYYDTGNRNDYAMWHKESDCFVAWIRKYVVKR